ncbi:MAG: peptide chain release factor 2 [Oscillospiraceae bacterium]|nr:peptide chain release factor 2 [Oscillospiraceae bacterium]
MFEPLIFEEFKIELNSADSELNELEKAMDIPGLSEKLAQLEAQTIGGEFWCDTKKSGVVLKEITAVKGKIKAFNKLKELREDVFTLIEIALEESDGSLENEIKKSLHTLKTETETQSLAILLTGEYDAKNAILSFHAGAGGTEAQDWVAMLYRMYTRWTERHGYKIKTLDILSGEEAGIKSVTVLIEGLNAYGFLKSESGVHRLVRISPFDASGRRHTSFASLEVMPEIEENTEIELKEEDLRFDTYRASGAGGQHVNKTESAVRVTHLPTGIAAACQNERSQMQNKAVAIKMLLAKLAEIKAREHLEKIEDIKGVQREIAWGSQIRSYVFMPYTLVKDHRTNFENGNINAVMDGDLDGFINAYLISC